MNSEDNEEGEILSSNSKMSFQRWIHVSLTKSTTLKLYINGILDKEVEIKKQPKETKSPKIETKLEDRKSIPILDTDISKLKHLNQKDQEKLLKTFKQAFLLMNSNV